MIRTDKRIRSRNRIPITNDQDKVRISPHIKLLVRRAVNATLLRELFFFPTEVSVSFVDDERIRELNKEFRNVDRATDVLSFPLEEADELGDIVISAERAVVQAKEYGHSTDREIAFLTVHSTLHLLGYDHESEEEEKVMFEIQKKVMEDLGLERNGVRL